MISSAPALALGAALLWAAAVSAAEWSDDADAPGHGAAQIFGPMQGAIAVQPLDNSTLNLELAQVIAEGLRQRGIVVADDAPLLLEFETTIDSTARPPRSGAANGPRGADIGRERDLDRGDTVDTRVDVFSNSRSSVVTGVRRPDISVYYMLRATLSEREGPRVWEGYAGYGEIVGDESRLYRKMGSLVASMVGTRAAGRFRAD